MKETINHNFEIVLALYVPNNASTISKCLCALYTENKGSSLLKTEHIVKAK